MPVCTTVYGIDPNSFREMDPSEIWPRNYSKNFLSARPPYRAKMVEKFFIAFLCELKYLDSKNAKKKFSTKNFRVRSMDGPPGSTSPGNISGTDKDFDMRFFANAQKRLELHSDQLSSKSLEPFLRKVWKTPFLTGFSPFSGEPVFFSKIRLCHFLTLINV